MLSEASKIPPNQNTAKPPKPPASVPAQRFSPARAGAVCEPPLLRCGSLAIDA